MSQGQVRYYPRVVFTGCAGKSSLQEFLLCDLVPCQAPANSVKSKSQEGCTMYTQVSIEMQFPNDHQHYLVTDNDFMLRNKD